MSSGGTGAQGARRAARSRAAATPRGTRAVPAVNSYISALPNNTGLQSYARAFVNVTTGRGSEAALNRAFQRAVDAGATDAAIQAVENELQARSRRRPGA